MPTNTIWNLDGTVQLDANGDPIPNKNYRKMCLDPSVTAGMVYDNPANPELYPTMPIGVIFQRSTTHVIFEPVDFIGRLAALVPKPRVNPTRFHGVFASLVFFIRHNLLRIGEVQITSCT